MAPVLKCVGLGLGVAFAGTSIGAVMTDGFGAWANLNWKPLSGDPNFSNDAEDSSKYKDKFGSKHKHYLTGLDNFNNDWWTNRHSQYKTHWPEAGKFKTVPSATGEETNSLKKICEAAYQASESDGFSDKEEEAETKFKKSEVWKYCSLPGVEPKTVDNESDYQVDKAIGTTKKSELLSTKGNIDFWKIKTNEFFGTGPFATETPKTEPEEAFFKKFFNDEKDKGIFRKSLSSRCEDAYKLVSNSSPTETEPKDTDVVKYCSI